jgi:galactokinase
MYDSHKGLSKKYEVSCEELDFLVDFTRDRDEVLGARMMGGGFGGCTLNLVKRDQKEKLVADIIKVYQAQFMRNPEIYEVNIVDGTSVFQMK